MSDRRTAGPEAPDFDAAIRGWRRAIGDDNVRTDADTLAHYGRNVTGFAADIPAVIRPQETSQVAEIVRIANTCRAPLHPVSCGKNWGLGSAVPPRPGTAILDLSSLNRILEVSVHHHYAVVEPGVTQGQLFDHLQQQGLPLVLNVTGSGRGASLIGNALERGIGYFASRADSMTGLEVVLGTGEVVQTGLRHYANARCRYLYRHGIGPSLDGLFAQSGYGIVTSAAVDLIPTPAAQAALIAKIDDSRQLPLLIDHLNALLQAGVIRTMVHIGDRARAHVTLLPLVCQQLASGGDPVDDAMIAEAEAILAAGGFGEWSAVIGVFGTRSQLRHTTREVRRQLRGFAEVKLLDHLRLARAAKLTGRLSRWRFFRRQSALIRAIEPIHDLTRGIPTDDTLKSVYWPVHRLPAPDQPLEPDQSDAGMLFCLPFLPADGSGASSCLTLIHEVCSRFGFEPSVTLNLVDSKLLEFVISIAFDRRDVSATAAAHDCIHALHADLIAAGILPYRLAPPYMSQVIDGDDPFWQVVGRLKSVFDPNNIISPGRYCPE